MPINFPDAPSLNDTHTDANGVVWTFDGTAWYTTDPHPTDTTDVHGIVDTSNLALNQVTPATVVDTTDTLASGDRFKLTMYSNASAVTVTVPTGTFAAGDWFLLQSTGAGGLSLSTSGITVNGSGALTGIAQNESLFVIFTAANTISVLGGTV